MNSVPTLFDHAAELPPEWDDLAGDNVFLERNNLAILERVNPCGQQYVLLEGRQPDSIITTYRHKLDFLTFASGHLSVPVTMIGIPCSVSACGFSLGHSTRRQAQKWISGLNGAKLVLNVPAATELEGLVQGRTLPSCLLDVQWGAFEDYMSSLRSHYRYEMNKTLRLGARLEVERLPDNAAYDDQLHKLYLNVYRRSEYKLERLTPEFFREFPGDIHVFRADETPVGFVKTLEAGKQLIFLFGGVDYGRNDEFRLYLNMLLFLVKEGIRRKVKAIDFGQTAEEAKLKLGCRYSGRHIYAGHSKAPLQWMLSTCSAFLSYRPPEEGYHVFKS